MSFIHQGHCDTPWDSSLHHSAVSIRSLSIYGFEDALELGTLCTAVSPLGAAICGVSDQSQDVFAVPRVSNSHKKS
ncbi:hypothetical protein Bca4012_039786 [Brassica carinata]